MWNRCLRRRWTRDAHGPRYWYYCTPITISRPYPSPAYWYWYPACLESHMLEIGLWAGGEGAGERETWTRHHHVKSMFLGGSAKENISGHLCNQRACDVTCRTIAGAWQFVLCGSHCFERFNAAYPWLCLAEGHWVELAAVVEMAAVPRDACRWRSLNDEGETSMTCTRQ